MMILIIFDYAPPIAHGFVRDIRVRWALEEAGLPYRVATVPFHQRRHFVHQPFGQVPFFRDGDIELFESGAILLHLGERSAALLPRAPQARAHTVSWLFAALNSVEPAASAWLACRLQQAPADGAWHDTTLVTLNKRLQSLENILQQQQWLGADFTIADIALADVLRLVNHFGDALTSYPACRDYVARATARPAFTAAYQAQLAHFSQGEKP